MMGLSESNRFRYGWDFHCSSARMVRIVPPEGWRILKKGSPVPHVHRYWIEGYGWGNPTRTISTMTPIRARVWGYMRAFAVPMGGKIK